MELREAEALALKHMAKYGLCADPSWDFARRVGWAGSNKKSWTFKWDTAYQRFGVCKSWQRVIGMSKKLVEINGEEEVLDTILHEIAHALVGPGHNHDEVWKQKCREVGARPVACYSSNDVATVQAKFEGRCPTCDKVYTKFRRPTSSRTYSCRCRPTGIPFNDRRYQVVFHKVGDIVRQPAGNACAAPVPVQPRINFQPPVMPACTWYAGRLLPIEFVQALKEENVAALLPEQLAYIQKLQAERGISYKSAVQYWRRNMKPAQVAATPTPAPVVVPEPVFNAPPFTAAPVDQSETILSDVPAVTITAPPTPPRPMQVGDVVVLNGTPQVAAVGTSSPAVPQGKWDTDIAIFMYQKGCKQIDIAEAMGYPRGSGQTRVRRALVAAGVWQGAK